MSSVKLEVAFTTHRRQAEPLQPRVIIPVVTHPDLLGLLKPQPPTEPFPNNLAPGLGSEKKVTGFLVNRAQAEYILGGEEADEDLDQV